MSLVTLASNKERRFHPRVACEIQDEQGQKIHNIGATGLYLESSEKYNKKNSLPLSFLLPPGNVSIKLEASVVRKDVLDSNRFGYGVRFKGIGSEAFQQIQYFSLYQTFEKKALQPVAQGQQKVFYKTIRMDTEQQNLTKLDPRLAEFLKPSDYFYIYDLTQELKDFVQATRIAHGSVMVQILHTSATLCVNELDEPMLLMDLVKKLRELAPKEASYFHNGPLRQVNLCAEDTHCDRNADAHVRSSLFGNSTVSLIIKDGKLVVGQWQKVALLEFDGPRPREVLIQVAGV